MTAPTPRVTVVVLAYNSAGFVADAVESVVTQSGVDAECIVLDNASGDETFAVLQQAYGGDDRVTLLRVEAGLGYAGGNNHAAARARGDILLFLNDDCVLETGALAALLHDFDCAADPAIVQCALTDAHGDAWTDLGHFVDRWGFVEIVDMPSTRSGHLAGPYRMFGAAGAALAVRRTRFRELGGFDDAMSFLYEETDLCWRANLRGWTVSGSARAVVRHRCLARYTTADAARRETAYELFTRHRLRSLMVNSEGGELVAALAVQIGVAAGFSVRELLRGHRGAMQDTVRALAWMGRHTRATWRRRREVQRTRAVTDIELIAAGVMLRPSLRRIARRARGDYGGGLPGRPIPTMAAGAGGGG